jgi:hypothetical protein
VKTVLSAELFHLFHELKHMRRDGVNIQREAEHDCLCVLQLIEDAGMIRLIAQFFADLFASCK